MKRDTCKQRFLGLLVGFLYALAPFPAVQAAPLNLANVPLFVASQVDPNVFFEVDDSGSMDWEITTRGHWHFCAYDSNAPWAAGSGECGWWVDNGKWRSNTGSSDYDDFVYLYANSDNAYNNDCGPDWRANAESCSASLTFDWRVRSSALNVTYYDPSQSYAPWNGPCLTNGTACANADFFNVRSDPRQGTSGYNVRRDLTGFVYEVWIDDKGYDTVDTRPQRGSNINVTNTPNGEVDLWDTHVRYTVNANSVTVETISYAPDTTGLNPTITSTNTISGAATDPWGRTVADIQQNVANWYQYHRRRSFATKAAIASVIGSSPANRYGLSVINNYNSLFVEVPPSSTSDYTSHNATLLSDLFDFDWPAAGTPLRAGLDRTGRYFDNTDGRTDPIINSCQKNFAILFTDGFWNGSTPSGVGEQDGDGFSVTVADVAKKYYDKDLSPLSNDVVPDAFDPATHQHMVTFTVAFGVQGDLVDTDGDGWPNPALIESSNWGDPLSCSDCPEKIDDLWHAAFNSKGTFVSAQTPQEVVTSLQSALQNIATRTASAAAVALSTGFISSDTRLYQARFNTEDWHGQLLAFDIDAATGQVIEPSVWDAGQLIPAASSRSILTYNGTAGIPFQWGSLTAAQQTALNKDINGTNDGLGQERLAYVRGDGSDEVRNGGTFRNRATSVMGDIVNSAPTFVGPPSFPYPDNWGSGAPESCGTCAYSAFKAAQANRTKMVYVGANDGMLHGFDATTGVEKIAFIPDLVIENLSALTATGYDHRYFVDGSSTMGDAFFGNAWHTVLAGGLNAGGQGIYALDITDPSQFSEANAASIVLWEFTDADDADLGYTYSRPAIVRMQNGKWAAVFGNGYNNTEADGNASTSGHAVLFIVDLEDGSLIKKIDTMAGSTATPNGLATTAPVDINGDEIIDAIYAGDLLGNLWKFDVSASNPSQWGVAFKQGNNPKPLFTAKDATNKAQPITVRPRVGRAPNNAGLMIYFGTGMYLQDADTTNVATQTFYGIIDDGNEVTGRNQLQEQTIDFQATQTFGTTSWDVRVTSTNTVDPNEKGWYMDLIDPNGLEFGERVVSDPILRNDRIIFTTLIPETSPCAFGGTGWLMELDAKHGARLDETPFDLNGDGVFDQLDYVTYDDDGDGVDDKVPASGKRSAVGIIPTPGILAGEEEEFKYTPGSSGEIEVTTENPGTSGQGRQSWRQLK